MGGGAQSKENAISIFDYKYQKERADLRKALIQSFLSNPKHHDIAEKIAVMRKLLTEHSDICATAEREAVAGETAEAMPTNLQAAYHELDRLIALYETSTILKSVQCRIGQVACPLGHYAGYVDSFSGMGTKDKSASCSMCDKVLVDGYHCGYCAYSLCVPCSAIYCCNGHAMKLWTHPESTHACVVCSAQPITSGYRCLACDDYDICDLCTWKPGRKVVQQVILDRIADDVAYLEAHVDESITAQRTMGVHSSKMSSNAYATTKHLYDFSIEVKGLREVAKAEVRQTRITKAICALRDELTNGKEYSRTACIESLVVDQNTAEELKRLRLLKEWYDSLKSVKAREMVSMACPLGHAAVPYAAGPPPYAVPCGHPPSLSADDIANTANMCTNQVPQHPGSICKVCDRSALPGGVHCIYCDYALCNICAVSYCKKGHRMAIWTEPAASETCFLCRKTICSGYRCNECAVDLCDSCTTKEARNKIRTDWEAEMGNLMGFMKKNRRSSDIAMFYQWRHANHVVSLGLLVDYVQELRTAKDQAQKQVEQKPIIDKIKVIRAEVCKHADLCATAAREAVTNENFVFPSKKKAAKELQRMADILRGMILAQSPERRLAAGVACPLAHAMDPMHTSSSTARRSTEPGEEDDEENEQLHIVPMRSPTTDKDEMLMAPLRSTQAATRSSLQTAMNTIANDFPGSPFSTAHMPSCSVCSSIDMAGGHVCGICDYRLCGDCSAIYCRSGHRCQIWTLHEAQSMTCDVCKKCPITSGYRCLTCQLDICDMCTTRDSRNAFLLWPKRELGRVLAALESIQSESPKAKDYLAALQRMQGSNYEFVMSKLCRVLAEAQAALLAGQDEVKRKVAVTKAHKYGTLRSREML